MNNSLENLYQKSRKETSPQALDDIILKAAKQSCEKNPKKHPIQRWFLPVASAAVFVMGFTLILNLQNSNTEFATLPELKKANPTTQAKPAAQREQQDMSSQTQTAEKIPETRLATRPETTPQVVKKKREKSRTPLTKIQPKGKPQPSPSNKPKLERQAGLIEEQAKITPKQVPAKRAKDNEVNTATNSYSEDEDKVELERVITTGSHIRISDDQDYAEVEEIGRLENLILHKRFAKAKRLLKKLKQKYPKYDFKEYEKRLKK